MKKITLALSLLLVLPVFAQTLRINPVTLKRGYIPVKPGYRHLRVTALPTRGGKVDAKAVLLRSSNAKNFSALGLNAAQSRSFGQVVRLLKNKQNARAKKVWAVTIKKMKSGSIPKDINSLIQSVLRESYLESNKDLQFYADKVRHLNQLKEAIRDHLSDMRKLQNSCMNCTHTTLGKVAATVKNLEERLASVGDNAQLANIDLQNALQKQQQTLQTMSNVSKMLHDTAMAIIRKIG